MIGQNYSCRAYDYVHTQAEVNVGGQSPLGRFSPFPSTFVFVVDEPSASSLHTGHYLQRPENKKGMILRNAPTHLPTVQPCGHMR